MSLPVRLKLVKALRHSLAGAAYVLIAGLGFGLAVMAMLYAALSLSPKPDLLANVPFGGMVLDNRGCILKISLSADQKYRLRVGLDSIAPEAARALLYYEDKYFYSHPGVNPASMLRAAFLAFAGGAGRKAGASTLTMQTARLRYKLKTSTLSGKLRQIWLALLMERHFSKQDILEAYFNLAPYGGNIEGIEAAARIYFDKPASRLTRLECHALAVIPQNPIARNPVSGPDFDRARARLEEVLSDNGDFSGRVPPIKARRPASLPFIAPHLAMELLAGTKNGASRMLTGIETDLQLALERTLAGFARAGRRHGLNNAAAILVNYDTMLVSAMAGSADFFESRISGQVDGTRARRSPGSTLKPFIYALALDAGLIHPMSMLQDSPRSFGFYDPENFDKGFRGPLPAHEALKASRNLPAIALTERLPEPGLYGFLRGADISFPHGPEHYGLALALGGAEVSMRQLAALYCMLANQGLWRQLRLEKKDAQAQPRRLLSPEAAWLALWMLRRNDMGSHSRGGFLPAICKTGTSNGLRDAWTAGIVGNYVLVVWVGNFDNQANPCFVGAKTALPLYLEIAQAIGFRRKLRDMFENPPETLNLSKVRACVSTGDIDNAHCAETEETWLIPGVSPVADSGILRPVLIDKPSGLRACRPLAGRTEEVWLEFWPTDMLQVFARAGINKPAPPQWLPECAREKEMRPASGKAPRIILPKKNVLYQRNLNGRGFRLPLLAAVDADAEKIHWFAGSGYIGSAMPGETLFWEAPAAGDLEILAVDDKGRSARRKCRILAAP